MTVTKDEFGKQNMFAVEPTMYVDTEIEKQIEEGIYQTHNEKAELINARWAMIGIVAGLTSYALTSKFFFGLV